MNMLSTLIDGRLPKTTNDAMLNVRYAALDAIADNTEAACHVAAYRLRLRLFATCLLIRQVSIRLTQDNE